MAVYAGDGPARSPELGAYLVAVEGGELLRVASDPGGAALWLAREEAAIAAADGERAAKDAALARIAALEEALARRG